jgi:lysozyme
LNDCNKLYPNYDDLPEEVQLIIANMMFNMGYPRMSGFKKMKEAVDSGDWVEASEQMKDSRWYRQVTNRADRLVNRMMVVNIV